MGDCRGAGQADGEMDVVLDAACAVAFAACVPGHRGEVRVEFGGDVWGEEGGSVFGAEDQVDQHEGEGLRHGERIYRFWGWVCAWGRCPHGVYVGPLALGAWGLSS